jgi:hypothetical protein
VSAHTSQIPILSLYFASEITLTQSKDINIVLTFLRVTLVIIIISYGRRH